MKKPQYTAVLQRLRRLVQHRSLGDQSEEGRRLRVQDRIRENRCDARIQSQLYHHRGRVSVHRWPRSPLLPECQPPGAVREGQPRPPHQVLRTLHHLLIQHRLHCQRYGGGKLRKPSRRLPTLLSSLLQKRDDILSLINSTYLVSKWLSSSFHFIV